MGHVMNVMNVMVFRNLLLNKETCSVMGELLCAVESVLTPYDVYGADRCYLEAQCGVQRPGGLKQGFIQHC